MRRKGKNLKQKRSAASKYTVAVVLCAVVLLSLGTGIVAARYLSTLKTGYGSFTSAEFYFTSDYLSEDGENYTILCNDLSTAAIDFQLFNYADSLNYSNTDIQYTIQYELNGIQKKQAATLAGGKVENTVIQYKLSNFTLNAFATQAVVTVTARAISPYEKDLKATFILIESENAAEYSVSDSAGSNVGTVTATTGGLGGKLAVTIPDGCFFDPTNSYPSDYVINVNELSFPANPDAEYAFVYLKETPSANYAGQVTVKLITVVSQ